MRKTLIALGSFCGLVIVLLLVLPYFISMERFREPIIQQIEERMDREVSMGSLQISLFPRVSLRISNLQIYEKDPKKGPFFHVDSFQLKLRFFPLLLGRIQVDEITLYKPFLKVVLQSDGTLNLPWFGTPKTVIVPSPKYVSYNKEGISKHIPIFTSDDDSHLSSLGPIFFISHISVSRGLIQYSDETRPSSLQKIKDIDLTIKNLSLTGAFQYSLSSLIEKQEAIRVSIRGEGIPNPKEKSITLKENEIDLGPLKFVLSGTVKQVFSNPYFNLNLQGNHLPLEKAQNLAKFLVGNFLPDFLMEGTTDLSLSIKGPKQNLRLSGNLSLEQAHLIYASLLKKETGTLSSISFKGLLTPNLVSIDSLLIQIASSDLMVHGKILMNPFPNIQLNLTSNRLEGRSWLLPPISAAGLVKGSKPLKTPTSSKEARSNLNSLKVRLNIHVQKGEIHGIAFSKLTGALNLNRGILRLSPISVQVAKGSYQGQVNLDLNKEIPPFQFSAQIRDIDVNTIFSAFPSTKGLLHGRLTSDFSLFGKGTNFQEIKKTTSGKGTIHLSNGRLPSLRLQEGLEKVLNLSSVDLDLSNGTVIQDLQGSFTLEKGLIHTNDLNLDLPGMKLFVKGNISLDQTLDLRITTKIETGQGDRLTILSQFPKDPTGKVILPIKLSGTLTQPKFSIDGETLAKKAIQNIFKRETHENAPNRPIENLLKGLFRGK